MSIRLHIKGKRGAAARAAKRFGVELLTAAQRRSGKSFETTAEAPCSDGVAVRRWYGKQTQLVPGRGYEGGTLLFFTERCEGLAGACPTGTVFNRRVQQCLSVRGEMFGSARRRR